MAVCLSSFSNSLFDFRRIRPLLLTVPFIKALQKEKALRSVNTALVHFTFVKIFMS